MWGCILSNLNLDLNMARHETKSVNQYRREYQVSVRNVKTGKLKICVDAAQIQVNIGEYLKTLDKSGYREWEVCHKEFKDACKGSGNVERLAAVLARYLVAFGMDRGKGKAFLKDSRKLIPVIELVLSSKYQSLFSLTPKVILEDCESVLKLCEASTGIRALLNEDGTYEATNTMISKILMGVYGTVPAFDRYLCASVQCRHVAGDRNFPVKHLIRMAKFYLDYEEDYFKTAVNDLRLVGGMVGYPEMRLVDIVMWRAGYLLLENE